MRVGTVVGRSAKLLMNYDRTCPQCLHTLRYYSSQPDKRDNGKKVSSLKHQKLLDRDFFLSVFSTTATKRDAKAYLARFKEEARPKKQAGQISGKEKSRTERLNKSGVNLGGLYSPARAIVNSPVFAHGPLPDQVVSSSKEPLHMAVVKIRGLEELDQETLKGVALTLTQLARLGLLSCVTVDGPKCDDGVEWREGVRKQCYRLANAINEQSKTGARVVDQALGVKSLGTDIPSQVHVCGNVEIAMRDFLLATVKSGLIPIIPPIAHTEDLRMQRVDTDDVVLALTRELAGIARPPENGMVVAKAITVLDKIIVLDPLGGLPAANKLDQSHIFVNLEGEYKDVRDSLYQLDERSRHLITKDGRDEPAGTEDTLQHVRNLDLIKNCLTLLPPSSSALLTTPFEAASSALFSSSVTPASPGVGTRPKRNPLIHNLLTDKPTVSSSLPTARMVSPSAQATSAITISTPATFFKCGMPLTMIPDPRISPWTPPGTEGSALRLESDPRVDFPRLLHLIEDSFGRPLDAQHYLNRIQSRIAGIIVAGEYEGGAILTWESPPSGGPAVPYLDKFAVLRKSQGSGGVADIVFNAMVRTCLPDGVVWRSRKNNPVNKWYFERSVGIWKLPGTQWCMFWTGGDVDFKAGGEVEKEKRWQDFVDVCSGIEASWADRDTKPPD